jgi:S1-C subfamily serine protease
VATVNRVVPQIIRDGRYIRPALGVQMDEGLNRRLSEMLQIEGVFVLRVQPGSAAEKAGLVAAQFTADGNFVPGDVILGVDGKPVTGVGELLGRLDDYKVGDTVKLELQRGEGKLDVPVTLQPGS